LLGWLTEAFSLYELQRKNLMLSDVEKGNNLMLTRLTPVATSIDTKQQSATTSFSTQILTQWLSTFFVLVHTFKFARKPVHPYHALKSTSAKVQNFYAVDVA